MDFKSQKVIDTYRSIENAGITAAKLFFIVNGGAAIGLLALIANLIPHHIDKVENISVCIFLFGVGALSAALSPALSFAAGWGEDIESERISTLGIMCAVLSFIVLFVPPTVFTVGLFFLYDELSAF